MILILSCVYFHQNITLEQRKTCTLIKVIQKTRVKKTQGKEVAQSVFQQDLCYICTHG